MYRKNDFTFYYPHYLLEQLSTNLETNPEFNHLLKPVHFHKILHFITYLYLKPYVDHRYDHGDFGYIHVSRHMMVKLYGERFYHDILTVLLQGEFIDKSPVNYKVGERTNAYRLSREYIGFGFSTLKCNSKLARKHNTFREENNKKNIVDQKVYDKLEATFRTITIDFHEAKEYLYNSLIYSLKNPETIKMKVHRYVVKGEFRPKIVYTAAEKKYLHNKLIQEVKRIAGESVVIKANFEQLKRVMDQYHSDISAITRIRNGGSDIHFDGDKCGRIHSNLTNIRSELRKFIKLDGKPIIGRDLVSSQPVFLACLLINKYNKREMPVDVYNYIQICLQGKNYGTGQDIYRFVMEKNNLTDRDAFKKVFYEKILFGEIPGKNMSKITQVFIKEFPNVWSFILKQKKDDHAHLAHNLQKLESEMFIGAAGELMKKGIKVLTLHDALYIHAEHQELTDQIILSRFYKKYGVTPTISN